MSPTFTVSTQTFNRKDKLPRVYQSLQAQTLRDFEWIIVDDGSSDGTDELVSKWRKEADFAIRYFYQQNRGKHVGFNWAVREAAGDLLLSFDSDDSCVPTALERFKYHWDSIPDKQNYSTVSALCMEEDGRVIGTKFPSDVVDSATFEEQYRFRASERWGINRTDILREYPFPELPGEHFVAEALVWNRLAMRYKARFVNEALRIYHRDPGGLVSSLDRIRVRSPRGARLYYAELSGMPVPPAQKARAIVNYIRFSLHAQSSMGELATNAGHQLLVAGLLPAGYLAYKRDCYRLKRQEPNHESQIATAGLN